MELAEGAILLSGGDDHLILGTNRRLHYSAEPTAMSYRPSVDVFFKSVAAHWPRTGIAALLTGMGRDGAEGLLQLRRVGWTTIAQDEATSVVWGMPRAAVALGAADHVLPLARIGPAIAEFFLVQNSSQAQARPAYSEKMLVLGTTGPVWWAGLPVIMARRSAGRCPRRRSLRRQPAGRSGMSTEPLLTQHKVTVLLIDDQPMIGEAVRRMLAGEPDIAFNYCRDANKALEEAARIKPTVILQDLVMPDIDGLTLVKNFRANEGTKETPMIVLSTKEDPAVKAEAFALGANDYIVKLPDRLELLARIRYHSKGYIALLQRNEAYQALMESQKRLANEVKQAARYVQSLLPEKLNKGLIKTDWRFVPSAELGGDSFGYHWLDDDHFAFYLLDVSGHGVGAALLSVSAMNALRSQALPNTDFRQPGQVLFALNNAFQMDQQNGLYFTIWYGVYHKPTRRVDYSGGGHPPALLINGPTVEQATLQILDSKGPMIGAVTDLEYESGSTTLDSFAKIYILSDGAYEIEKADKSMWPFSEFLEFMGQGPHQSTETSKMDLLIAHDRQLMGTDDFADDLSLVELIF